MSASTTSTTALLSALRVFAMTAFVAYFTLGKPPESVGLHDLRGFAWAGVGAVLVTAYDWLNPGDTRFGRGANTARRAPRAA